MFSIAYRMLGSATEAEDIVPDDVSGEHLDRLGDPSQIGRLPFRELIGCDSSLSPHDRWPRGTPAPRPRTNPGPPPTRGPTARA
jgi:hypothetical protein